MPDLAILTKHAEPICENSAARWHSLLAVGLGQIFDGMDASIFTLALYPALSELMHTSSYSTVGTHGAVVTATFLAGWAIGGAASGILSDYVGRTRVMMLTILLYALCTGLCAISHSWVELAFYRFLVGCGIGGEITAGGVLIAEYWKGNSRLYASGLLPGGFCVGYLLAALLNLAVGNLSWRWLFAIGIVPALLTVYIRAKLKDSTSFQAMQELKENLRNKPRADLTYKETELLSFTLGRLFKGEYAYRTLLAATLTSTTVIGHAVALSWVPAWINQLMGTGAVQERSIVAITMNIGSIIAAATAGLLVIRVGRRNAFRWIFSGSLISCLAMFLTVKTFCIPLLLWAFAAGFFSVMPFALLVMYIPELFNTEILGTAFGFTFQTARITAAISALLGGQIVLFFGGSYAMAGASLAAVYLLGIITSFFIPETSGEIS